jgi:hypothetical protein
VLNSDKLKFEARLGLVRFGFELLLFCNYVIINIHSKIGFGTARL